MRYVTTATPIVHGKNDGTPISRTPKTVTFGT